MQRNAIKQTLWDAIVWLLVFGGLTAVLLSILAFFIYVVPIVTPNDDPPPSWFYG